MKFLLRPLLLALTLLFSVSITKAQTFHPDFWDGKAYLKFADDYEIHIEHKYGVMELQSMIPHLEYLISENGIRKVSLPFYALKDKNLDRTLLLEFDSIRKTEILLKAVRENFAGRVEYIEQVPIDRFDYTPNDLGNNTTGGQYALWLIKAREAWDIARGDTNIVVAVVDDGYYRAHPDLNPTAWRNMKEVPGNGIDDDGNGYVDDIWGWDAGNNDGDPLHPNTNFLHGTHVGGIVGAATDNGLGIASVGFGVKVMGVKCTQDGSTNTTNVPFSWQGLTYAVASGAHIINCSWSSPVFSQTNQNIVLAAFNKGVSITASAGNSNSSNQAYPAAYNTVIAVASTDINDVRSSFSNFGTWVNISAPGSSIRSTVPASGYQSISGTSMSSPMVAGLLGLMKSHYPGATLAELEGCLLNTADDIDSKNSAYIGRLGKGRINAEKAVKCIDALRASPPESQIQSSGQLFCPDAEVEFFGSAKGKNADRFRWYFPGGTPATADIANPKVKYNAIGDYDVVLVTENNYGKDSAIFMKYIMIGANGTEQFWNRAYTAADSQNTNLNGWQWQDLSPNTRGITAHSGSPLSGSPARMTLITELFSTENHSNINLKLDYAYGRRNSCSVEDTLIVSASTDGGLTFEHELFRKTGTEIRTVNNSNSNFIPTNSNQWCSNCAEIPADVLKGNPNAIVKIDFVKRGCGQLFFKGIAASGTCSGYNNAKPIGDASSDIQSFCIPRNVKFTSNIRNFPDSFRWYFPGGNPAESVDKAPQIEYENSGIYDVKLISWNEFGTDTLILNDYISAFETPVVKVVSSDTLLCPGESAVLTASGADSYSWSPLVSISASSGTSVTVSPQFTTKYTASGSRAGCSGEGFAVIWVEQEPERPKVFQDGPRLFTDAVSDSFRWEIDGVTLVGENKPEIFPKTPGLYRVIIISANGCPATSLYFYFDFLKTKSIYDDLLKIYPNPASDFLMIDWQGNDEPNLSVTDITGREWQNLKITKGLQTIHTAHWASGVYLIKFSHQSEHKTLRLVISR